MKILISPYSVNFSSHGGKNAKNYPYWQELIDMLVDAGHEVYQIHCCKEKIFKNVETISFDKIYKYEKLILSGKYDTFISVDNFFHHLAAYCKFPGYVIFGKSDPSIFGHKIHTNIYKNKKYFRPNQFDVWFFEKYNEDVFVKPKKIFDLMNK